MTVYIYMFVSFTCDRLYRNKPSDFHFPSCFLIFGLFLKEYTKGKIPKTFKSNIETGAK